MSPHTIILTLALAWLLVLACAALADLEKMR